MLVAILLIYRKLLLNICIIYQLSHTHIHTECCVVVAFLMILPVNDIIQTGDNVLLNKPSKDIKLEVSCPSIFDSL
jgi:hypothetical protein